MSKTSSTILLVEDNPSDAELTLDTLHETIPGTPIVWVKDGAQALDYLLGTGEFAQQALPLPKVVLLDLRLPKVDGLQVLQRMRAEQRTSRVPVVILTSSQEECDISRGYDLGTNAYVVKPVDSDRFVQAVRELGLFWDAHNRTVGE
jgi:two-component system response regulator